MPSQMKKERKKGLATNVLYSWPELVVTDCDGLMSFWLVADNVVIVGFVLLFKAKTLHTKTFFIHLIYY